MVGRSFDACGITTTDSSKVQSRSFYKSCMENASKHLQNDEEDLFILWFYTVIFLGSLKRKKNKNLKYCLLFLSDWKYVIRTIEHEVTLKNQEFILNLIEKVKPGFSLFSMCLFPESNGTKS